MSVIFHPFEQKSPFAVVALNKAFPAFFSDAWNIADLRICSDKGSKLVLEHFKDQSFKQPDLIACSSQQSLQKCKSEFSSGKTEFVKYEDDSKTDIAKCVELIKKMNYDKPVLVLGSFDESFGKMASLLHTALEHEDMRICLLDDRNFTTWVFPHNKKILTPQICTTHMCGLVPLLKPVTLTTKGLKWDLDKTTLAMGDFISTSNEIAAPEIKIDTPTPILWTAEAKRHIQLQ